MGPLKVLEKASNLDYVIQLPPGSTHHPKFHVDRLTAQRGTPPSHQTQGSNPLPMILGHSKEYEVEEILQCKKLRGKTHYLVKWKGYQLEESTWEPLQNLKNAPEALKKFREKGLPREEDSVRLTPSSPNPVDAVLDDTLCSLRELKGFDILEGPGGLIPSHKVTEIDSGSSSKPKTTSGWDFDPSSRFPTIDKDKIFDVPQREKDFSPHLHDSPSAPDDHKKSFTPTQPGPSRDGHI